MAKKVRARFSQGKIEPLEQLELQEGEEFVISVEKTPTPGRRTRTHARSFPADALLRLAGIAQGEGATDVSQNKHKYVADAYAQKEP